MKTFKKLLSLMLTLFLTFAIVGAMPVFAENAGEGTGTEAASTYVAVIGETGYTSLKDAVAAADADETITLIADVTLSESLVIPANKTIILDLDGKTVAYDSTTMGEAMISNKGNLTINDTLGTGVINYNYTGAADSTYGKGNYTISNGGTLTVNGGKITIANIRAHAKYPIDNNSTSGDAVLVINGGHLYNYNTCAIRQFCNSTTYLNSVTINGGLIEGYCAIWVQNPGKNTVNGQLTINGGEIKTTAAAYVNGTLALKDVSSRVYCTIDGAGGAWREDSFVSITGGTLNENVDLDEAAPANITIGDAAIYNGRVELPVCVAKIGNTSYTSLQEAIEAAKVDDTITLLAPVVVNAGETLTLDKAVTITYTSNVPGEDMITNKGNLVIDGATLVYTNTDTTASNVTVSTISCEPGSELSITAGSVSNKTVQTGSIYAYAIDLLTNGSLGDVTATISGGSVYSDYMAIRQFNNGDACNNSLTVTDGYIYGAKRAIQVHLKNDAAYLTISGGKVEADKDGYALCLFPENATHYSVTGGEFIGTVYSGTNSFISGGRFDVEPYYAYVKDGYIVKTDADVYTVVAASVKVETPENTTGIFIPTAGETGETTTIDDTKAAEIVDDIVNNSAVSSLENNKMDDEANNANLQNAVNSFVTDKSEVLVNSGILTQEDIVKGTISEDKVKEIIDSAEQVVKVALKTVAVDTTTGEGTAETTFTVTKVSYDVTPSLVVTSPVENTQVSIPVKKFSAPVTFRLPIPSDFTADYVKVTHIGDNEQTGEVLGYYIIKEEAGKKFVEISSADFSQYDIEPAADVKVAEIDGVQYTTLAAALTDAQTKVGTVKLIVDEVAESTVLVPTGVTLDLNGKTLTTTDLAIHGNLVDGETGGTGSFKANSISVQNNKNPFLPIYDSAANCYRLYAFTFENYGGESVADTAGNTVKYRTAIKFQNIEAYNLIANSNDTKLQVSFKLVASGNVNCTYVFDYSAESLKTWATNSYNDYIENPAFSGVRAMTLTISGFNQFTDTTFTMVNTLGSETGMELSASEPVSE